MNKLYEPGVKFCFSSRIPPDWFNLYCFQQVGCKRSEMRAHRISFPFFHSFPQRHYGTVTDTTTVEDRFFIAVDRRILIVDNVRIIDMEYILILYIVLSCCNALITQNASRPLPYSQDFVRWT